MTASNPKILIITTSAIEFSLIQQTFTNLKSLDDRRSSGSVGGKEFVLLRSDPGVFSLSYHLSKELCGNNYELAVNAGICGAYSIDIPLGEVVYVKTDLFADIGTEDGQDLFDMGLMDKNEYPFLKGELTDNPGRDFSVLKDLRTVRSITVNRITQTFQNISFLNTKYHPDIESMEGAAFFYICALEKVNYIQVRAVSNGIAERDKSKWEIKSSVQALSHNLDRLIREF